VAKVSGWSLVPEPPARTMPFMFDSLMPKKGPKSNETVGNRRGRLHRL